MLWVKDRTDLFDFCPMLLHPKFDFDFENLIFLEKQDFGRQEEHRTDDSP